MNIIVAGGAGFLGSHLSEKLVEEGNDVTVVDDLSSGLEGNLSNIRRRIHFIKSDIVDFDSDDKFDVIFNLASNDKDLIFGLNLVENLLCQYIFKTL